MGVFGIPSSLFGGTSHSSSGPNVTAQAWILGIELGLIWLAGGWIIVSQLRRGAPEPMTPFARVYPATYLVVMAVLWLASLSAYFGAKNGITSDGTPIGSGLYALACFIGAAALLAVLHRSRNRLKAPVASTR
jgi:hypothetical protein